MFADNLIIFLAVILVTIILLRVSLTFFPRTDVFVGRYNVHHLYTGAFLLVLLTPFLLAGFLMKLFAVAAGLCSGFILDHLVCLITSDGGERAYKSFRSFAGMVVLTSFVVIFTLALYFILVGFPPYFSFVF